MLLEELPVEVLELIIRGQTSCGAFGLWKTGNRHLLSKLSNNGIKELELVYRSPRTQQQVPISLPESLISFKLRSLSLSCFAPPKDLSLIRNGIKQLHPELKSLTLLLPGAISVLFGGGRNLGDSTDSLGPMPSKRPKKASRNGVEGDSWTLRKYFMELEELRIVDIAFESCTLQESHLAQLPRSLTSFSCGFSETLPFSSFKDLPRKLVRLELPDHDLINLQNYKSLPSTLTSVRGINDSELIILLAKKSSKIFPHLVEFPFSQIMSPGDEYFEALKGSDGKWPATLSQFSFRLASSEAIFTALPLKTAVLRISRSPSPFDIYSSILTKFNLPHLTELYVTKVDWSEITSNMWPPLLTHLELASDVYFGPHHYYRLPRSLKTLVSMISDALTTMTLDMVDVSEDSSLLEQGRLVLENHEKEIWSTLKLQLIQRGEKEGGRELLRRERYIEEVEKGSLYGLPLALVSLKLERDNIYKPPRLILPPRLTILSTWTAAASQNIFWYLLPPSLTSIIPSPSLPFAANTIFQGPPSESEMFNCRSLVSLSLTWFLKLETGACLAYLPRSLRSLTLSTFQTTLEASWIKTLPEHLEQLSLYCQAISPFDAWTCALPKTLTSLYTTCSIWGQDFDYLPKTLTIITASFKTVQIDHILQLPTRIREIVVLHTALTNVDETRVPFERLLAHVFPLWHIWNLSREILESIMSDTPIDVDQVNEDSELRLRKVRKTNEMDTS